ncbi:hypothetical protein N431DRAFT_397594 [Stipitochalara longipes BDJ]|nr:hypothetical protein N431DRAFT_397594 [Stipitochalara longipes BDJ]
MPFGINRHSNRSKQALNDPAAQGTTGTPSSGSATELSSPVFTDETRTAQPQAFNQQIRPDGQPFVSQIVPDSERQQRSGDLPARSQSTRYVSAYQPQGYQPSGSADDLTLDSRKHNQQGGAPISQQPAPEPAKKSKNIFDRMRSGSSRSSEQKPPPPSYNNTAGLARRLSKRQETPPVIRTVQQRNSVEQQRLDWSAGQDSRSHLPSPQEGSEDESQLDPYLIREAGSGTPYIALNEGGLQSIRPVQEDTEPPLHPTDEDHRLQFEAHQQHLREQAQQYHAEVDSQPYYQPQNPGQPQVNIDPSSLINDPYRQNPETVSQLSYDSPTEQELRPASVQSNGQSPTAYTPTAPRQEYPSRTTSIQAPRPISQYGAMAPPPPQQSRRTGESKQPLPGNGQGQGQPESREGPPPGYSRGQFPANAQPPTPGLTPTTSVVGTQGPNYRGGPPQRDQYGPQGGGEQGRSTPPPAPAERDVNDAYKELLTKYKKVKGLYFDKTAQVEQLQNTLANQRLSQSRTSLDDSEYMTRFQRLDGATTNLAFNIRKDWRSIPPWLVPYVNQDALKIGKQEMTAVGRAAITKFLVEEVFNRTFHPGLETELSLSLKTIEQNIRRFSPALNNQEESDALTAKVVQWRLATLEGLKDVLSSPTAEENKEQFKRIATTNLTASLLSYLQEPVPAGIEDSAHMIVELAVSIAANLPLESRDISIVYPMPGDMLQPMIMKVETGIPALENPGIDASSEADAASTGSGDKDDVSKDEKSSDGKLRKEKTKSGMLSAMMGGNSGSATSKKSTSTQGGETSTEGKKAPVEDGAQKVRLAGFVGVEVRGRQMLVKSPVWTVS